MPNKADALSVLKILKMKESGEKIAMITAYDYPSAQIADAAGADMILVGDSVASVVQGRSTTLGVRLEDTIYHTEMVQRAVRRALVVADMPFPYCQLGPTEAVRACRTQFVKIWMPRISGAVDRVYTALFAGRKR